MPGGGSRQQTFAVGAEGVPQPTVPPPRVLGAQIPTSTSGHSIPAAFTWQGHWGRGQGRSTAWPRGLGLQSQAEQQSRTGHVTMGESLNLSGPLLLPLQGP